MKKKLDEKFDYWGRVIEGFKKLIGSLKHLLISLVVTGGSLYYAWQNKDMFIQEGIKKLIHTEAVHEVDERYAHSDLRRKDSIEIARLETKINNLNFKYNKLQILINEDASTLATVIEIQDANQLHREFNTKVSSIQSELLLEMMEKIESTKCEKWVYYKTHAGDAWKVFDDKYESRVPYSLDLRSNCRAYYTPIKGNKIKAN